MFLTDFRFRVDSVDSYYIFGTGSRLYWIQTFDWQFDFNIYYSKRGTHYQKLNEMECWTLERPTVGEGVKGNPIDFSDLKLKLWTNENETFSTYSLIMNAYFVRNWWLVQVLIKSKKYT